MSRLG
ncbi:ATP-dependent helicase HrpB, partial [Yersinia pestis PY-02]